MNLRQLVLFLALPAALVHAQERSQARSMVMTDRGIVATSQTLASQAGAQVLARGGSAVDAAIAANAMLGLVEPMMDGIGGDLFVIYYEAKSGKLYGYNGSGRAGRNMSIAALKAKGFFNMPTKGIHTVTVPGAVEGWDQLHKKFGKLPWRDLLQPAIYHAKNGFPVTEIIQYDWESGTSALRTDDNARRVFLNAQGRAPQPGEVFKNPELAKAYSILADGGAAAYYKGPIAQAILATSKRLGGLLTAEDLSTHQGEWVEPISTTYRGWKVSELPPNGQGIGALQMLNLFEKFDLPGMDPLSAAALHLKIEAQKLAYQDLRKYVGDPRFVKVPVAGMLDKDYAAERAKLISLERANCETSPGMPPAKGSGNTIYLSVVDREGNIASWIQSISDLWGSHVVVDGMGFTLHDRGGGFLFDESQANALAPGKRPFHTIIPGFMQKGTQSIGFGIMRGLNQSQAHAQFVSYVADHGANIQMALEGTRFTRRSYQGCDVLIESRVPAAELDKLRALGHYVDVRGAYSGQMGGGQAVMYDAATGVKFGGSSPRKDGAAIPEPVAYWPK
ncbi:MAG: gamma-glutamyltransferase [Acidobacteria bacterium]|nr:gamma-glutamyltransferase [Acidobacteriota bacterium]